MANPCSVPSVSKYIIVGAFNTCILISFVYGIAFMVNILLGLVILLMALFLHNKYIRPYNEEQKDNTMDFSNSMIAHEMHCPFHASCTEYTLYPGCEGGDIIHVSNAPPKYEEIELVEIRSIPLIGQDEEDGAMDINGEPGQAAEDLGNLANIIGGTGVKATQE